jgi:5-methylcytosine-specific restriction endonuclease McrA
MACESAYVLAKNAKPGDRIQNCKHCGKLHIQRRKGSIYCSKACATNASSARRSEHRKEVTKQWRKNNAERAHATAKAYRKANRASETARQRRWRRSPYGKEAHKAAIRKWTLANPEASTGIRLRRAKAEVEGNATPELIAAKWEGGNKNCCLCGKPTDRTIQSPDPMSFSIEHLIPISRGGRHDIDNIDFAHRVCNSSKGNRTLEEYRERLK